LKILFERINDVGYQFSLSEEAKDYIADKGFDRQYGARPLNRAIQNILKMP